MLWMMVLLVIVVGICIVMCRVMVLFGCMVLSC